MTTTLIINTGSSSRKYALYEEGQPIFECSFEATESGFEMCSQKKGSQQTCESVAAVGAGTSFSIVAKIVTEHLEKSKNKLTSIGIRIVAPGTLFQKHAVITNEYLSALRNKLSAAPLHVPVVLEEIEQIKKHFPDVKLVGISDSAFHVTLPFVAREYTAAQSDLEVYDLHRFGCHGLSVASVVHRVHSVIGNDPARMVVCHVGNGVSVTAVKEGVSVDTSVGYSPVSGVPMGTRASDLDPSALLELMRMRNMRVDEANEYVNKKGGLQGLAGNGDIRHLLDRRSHGDVHARQGLELFAYHIQKAIASSTIALGGLDAIVFTGTASFRSSELRSLLVDKLTHLGASVDMDRNDFLVGKEGVISAQRSMVKIAVMRTDEMGEMARIAVHTSANK